MVLRKRVGAVTRKSVNTLRKSATKGKGKKWTNKYVYLIVKFVKKNLNYFTYLVLLLH